MTTAPKVITDEWEEVWLTYPNGMSVLVWWLRPVLRSLPPPKTPHPQD